jgi:hypothetical protein
MTTALPKPRQLASFVAGWYQPLTERDGYEADELDSAERRLGVRMPLALREWYALAGKRPDIWSQQDHLLAPSELQIVDNALVFCVENQAVVRWAIELSELENADPPIVVLGHDVGGRAVESDSLSSFALAMLACCVKWRCDGLYWANGAATPQALAVVESHCQGLPLGDWHWPCYPTRFFGTEDINIETNGPLDDAW